MEDITQYIALTLLDGVGPIQAKNLISYTGSAASVFKQSKQQLLKIPGIGLKTADSILKSCALDKAKHELDFMLKHDIKCIPYTSKSYPKRLAHCADNPILLYKKGSASLNFSKTISIVGTRKATKYGKDFIIQLLTDLKDYNIQVVSGLALGIDGQAHKSAIENGLNTVAVLGHSLDTVYPPTHTSLAKEMLSHGGALISEYASFSTLHPSNFPMRNRIIAGMCDALIVIESTTKGGAIISANIANSYNRDVFALPGRYKDKSSQGCNLLLKTLKAQVIEHAQDLIKAMSWDDTVKKPKRIQRQLALDLSEEEERVINVLKEYDDLESDLLMVKSNMNASKLAVILLELELKGIIYSLPGNRFSLA